MQKTWFTAVAALVLALCSAPLHAGQRAGSLATTHVHAFHPELKAALQDLKQALLAPRTPLAFDNGASAENCAQYLNRLSAGQPEESVHGASIRAEYLVCDAVRFIANEPFTLGTDTAPSHVAKALFERLDLRSFPSSLHNRADAQRHTLKQLLASAQVTMTPTSVEGETDEQAFSLHIAAVVRRPASSGNVKTRQSEWIVWVADEMKNGNYRSYRTLVVRPPTQGSGGRYTGWVYPPQ